MDYINTLEEKVEKAQEKVEKCKATIERHKKALDKKVQAVKKQLDIDLTGKTEAEIEEIRNPYRTTEHSWTIYEVISKQKDIKGAEKKLADAEQIVANWQAKLDAEINREKFIQDNAPQVIKDFLEDWKNKAREWHIKRYNDYQDFKKKLEEDEKQARIECLKTTPEYSDYLDENGDVQKDWRGNYKLNDVFPRKPMKDFLEERNLDYRSIQKRKAEFAGGAILHMDTIRNEEKRLEWLEKTLEREQKAKMIDLISRISKVVGEITDASHLHINQKGNIDGFVIGNKGKAKVDTIGAGGWNIVCFHWRTLVKPMK